MISRTDYALALALALAMRTHIVQNLAQQSELLRVGHCFDILSDGTSVKCGRITSDRVLVGKARRVFTW